jgi:hypothetical protein
MPVPSPFQAASAWKEAAIPCSTITGLITPDKTTRYFFRDNLRILH